MMLTVLRIHVILVWIRIGGSMPLTNGSGSCYFRHWPSTCQQKTIFLQFFLLHLHLHHFSKIKVKKSHKIVGIKVFLTIFAWWCSVADPGCLSRIPDPDFHPSRIPDLGSKNSYWYKICCHTQCFGSGSGSVSGSVLDPYSIGPLDPDPDP